MSFASFVDRARNEFIGVPGLELSLPQAVRLWNLGADDCRYVLDALVDVGFLAWTPRRTVVRTGRELHMVNVGRDESLDGAQDGAEHRRAAQRPDIGPTTKVHIPVRKGRPANKSVGY
jgi:hypothetical protein